MLRNDPNKVEIYFNFYPIFVFDRLGHFISKSNLIQSIQVSKISRPLEVWKTGLKIYTTRTMHALSKDNFSDKNPPIVGPNTLLKKKNPK